jgi:glycine/D-amino acid oxidase-like deaminating enzyme
MAARQSTDVAIIGGGIAGCASAYYLAKKGLSVTLLEKGEIAGEQSGRNWGFVRQQLRDPLEIPLMIACIRIWRGLEAELEADIEWRQGGILHLADTDVEMAKYEAWLEHARTYQLDSRKVSGAEAAELLPGMAHDWIGGIYTPSDGQADPVKTTNAFAKAARRLGAEIRTGCIVEGIETAGGAVTGLSTEAGEIRAKTVLVAAGAWSARLLRTLGLDLPQLGVRSTVLRTRRAPAKTALGVWFPEFGFRQRRDGSFNVGAGASVDHDIGVDTLRHARAFWSAFRNQGGSLDLHLGRHFFEDLWLHLNRTGALGRQMRRDRVLDPAPSAKKLRGCLAGFRAMFPEFGDIDLATSWAGVIDVMPDEVPVFGEAPGLRGLVIATGFSGHGFGMGPIAGQLMAEAIAEGQPSLDLAGFRFDRFGQGHGAARLRDG